MAQSDGCHVDIHAPLPSEFRLVEWAADPDAYEARLAPVIDLLKRIESGQDRPPVFVIHGANDDPILTLFWLRRLLDILDSKGSRAVPVIEVRAPSGGHDKRFDRDPLRLVRALSPLGPDRVGMCWDIAHDWERERVVTSLTPDLMRWIRHVHLHDERADGYVHAPLGNGVIPWQSALRQLREHSYEGSITLEIRYRYASEIGEPWAVLADSLAQVAQILEME
jgi:fermentation-respiration switch protein FrsA (DUF1100 family)